MRRQPRRATAFALVTASVAGRSVGGRNTRSESTDILPASLDTLCSTRSVIRSRYVYTIPPPFLNDGRSTCATTRRILFRVLGDELEAVERQLVMRSCFPWVWF